MAKGKELIIDLPPGTVCYTALDKPRAWKEGDEPRYQITVAWPVAEFDAKTGEWPDIKRAIHGVAVDAWGDRAKQRKDGAAPYKVPFTRGEDRENPEQFAGLVIASAKSKWTIPCVRLVKDGPPVKMDPAEIRKGMRVSVAVKPDTYAASFRGVTLYAYAVALEDERVDEAFVERTQSQSGAAAAAHFEKRRRTAPAATPTGDSDTDRAEENEAAERGAHDTAEDYATASGGGDEPLGDGDDIPF